MNRRYRPTKRSPSSLIGRERYDFLTIGNQMRAKYWTHPGSIAGTLEVDCSIHSIGIGAGERSEPLLCRCLGESLGTRGAESKGKVGMGVEVGEHGDVSCELTAHSRTHRAGDSRPGAYRSESNGRCLPPPRGEIVFPVGAG